MTDLKLFQLSNEDKLRYFTMIEKINIDQKFSIMNILGSKIQNILDDGHVNSIEAELISDMAQLVEILEFYPDLPEIIEKKILFAMSYFIDENDEIPDVIPDYGYLDDITVVTWIIDDIRGEIPEMTRA